MKLPQDVAEGRCHARHRQRRQAATDRLGDLQRVPRARRLARDDRPPRHMVSRRRDARSVASRRRRSRGGGILLQETDVLDTWFSSGLWPFSTLGWPQESDELKYWYPTSVMETGYDIIFLWVARMIMLGLYCIGEIPFSTVYLHGTVRNDRGQAHEQVARHRRRPDRDDREVRRRRATLHADHGGRPPATTSSSRIRSSSRAATSRTSSGTLPAS